jgi:hypothetical protein
MLKYKSEHIFETHCNFFIKIDAFNQWSVCYEFNLIEPPKVAEMYCYEERTFVIIGCENCWFMVNVTEKDCKPISVEGISPKSLLFLSKSWSEARFLCLTTQGQVLEMKIICIDGEKRKCFDSSS